MRIPGEFPRIVPNLVPGQPGFICSVVGNQIHAKAFAPDGQEWVFSDRNGPLSVEPSSFEVKVGGADGGYPDVLVVRLKGDDEYTVLFSSDDFHTFEPVEDYIRRLGRMAWT